MENYNKDIEFIEKISSRLNAIHSTVLSLQLGLKSEDIQQAVDVLECIDICINDTKKETDSYLKKYNISKQ